MNELDLLQNFAELIHTYCLTERLRYENMNLKEFAQCRNHIEYPKNSPYPRILQFFTDNDYKMVKEGIYEILFQKIAQVNRHALQLDLDELKEIPLDSLIGDEEVIKKQINNPYKEEIIEKEQRKEEKKKKKNQSLVVLEKDV